MLRIRNLQVDVPAADHGAAVRFWAAALGGEARAVGGPYTHLDGVRSRVGVHVQRVEQGPGGYHLDLEADDVEAAVQRLVDAGAEEHRAAGDGEPGARLLVDPAGLVFCVTATGQEQHLDDARDAVHLRVLMLDVPDDVAETEAAFWATALGGDAQPVGERYPEYTWVHGVAGPGGPINVAVQALGEGEPRLHVDLHCPDAAARDGEVDRLVGLGAVVRDRHAHWVVLEAPGGHLACVVPDRAE